MRPLANKIVLSCCLIAGIGLSVFAVISLLATDFEINRIAMIDSVAPDFEFVKESEYLTTANQASMETYGTLAEMNDRAVMIAEVQIIDQQIENILEAPPLPVTWSVAEVREVYKGDNTTKSIVIGEIGGMVDRATSKTIEKESNGIPINSENVYEYTIQGSPVMKKGNTYIVLLEQGTKENTYAIVGTVQGKLRISDTTNKGVVTIDPEIFAKQMNELFWFQRKFAGKDKADIAAALKNY
ncbi:hypothetical protein CIG75_09545 [Tumebacillus algifaecis]|uniref:Uncharacterized protein n=1 Tax=Tumebacillus algifaecis TaxID=1214604 RepID=A0A223D0W9_9BACL|nr:hypothetical protein [Tumebacillus algifaecis]ASS75201.1 hypothetical protein CIG75_09545 [Tumebacillus algifaecis]